MLDQSTTCESARDVVPDALEEFGTIPKLVVGVAELSPGATAVVDGDQRLTFAETAYAAVRVARRLQTVGVRPGDRVGVLLGNSWEYAVIYFGVQLAGGIAVLVNTRFTGPEVTHVCEDSGARLIVSSDRFVQVTGALPRVQVVDIGEVVSAKDLHPGAIDTVALGGLESQPEETCQLLYTSGTTGHPKGVMQRHSNVLFNARTVHSLLGAAPGERTLIAAPMFHAIGAVSQLVGFYAAGATSIIMPTFDVGKAVKLIESERVTIFAGVAAMLQLIILRADEADADLSTLSRFVMGGSPVPDSLPGKVAERLPNVRLANVWGLTEATSIATYTEAADYTSHPGSAGRPIAEVQVWVAIDGAPPSDEREAVGELCVRGPVVTSGYWNKPEATAAAFTDGWLHTGDVGMIDEDGHVYVLDRLKDMIIRGGENVYSLEVENALVTHPSLKEVAVVGAPDQVLGEVVAAVVVPADGTEPDLEELRQHASATLADYKRPDVVHMMDELPRNPSGKVLKRTLARVVADLLEA